MRKYMTIFILALCTGFFCCSMSSDKSKDSVPDPFRKFIKKFKPLHLPSTFRTSLGTQASASPTFEELNGLPEYDEKSYDTLFMKDFGPQTVYYGMLPDTSNYFGLVVLLEGVQGMPAVLVTFDKSGKQISQLNLYCGNCMASMEIGWCSSTGIIKNDLSIYSVDSIKNVKRDNDMNVIDSSGEYFSLSKNGKISSDGKITMSDEQKKNLK